MLGTSSLTGPLDPNLLLDLPLVNPWDHLPVPNQWDLLPNLDQMALDLDLPGMLERRLLGLDLGLDLHLDDLHIDPYLLLTIAVLRMARDLDMLQGPLLLISSTPSIMKSVYNMKGKLVLLLLMMGQLQ